MMATGLPPGSGLPDVNKGPQIVGAITTTTILALIVLAMRLYVRFWMLRTASFDDYFMIAGMTCSFISFAVNIAAVTYGAGRHAAYIFPPSKITTGLRLNFITQPLLLAGVTLVKVSIGFFLLRIAPSNWYRRPIIGTNTFLLGITTFFVITLFVQCRPLAAVWDLSLRPTATCWEPGVLRNLAYANSSLNIITDIGFTLIPWPILWNLQVTKRIKVALLAVLSLGIFACASSIRKITFVSSYGLSGDFLYDSTELCIWTTTELNVGILAASIPCLKPLFRVLLEKSGRVPKDSILDVPGLSYFMHTSAARSYQECGDENQVDWGDRGMNMQILKRTELTKTAREHVGEIGEQSMLLIGGPVIVNEIAE